MSDTKTYVAGFLYSEDKSKVALIRKQKPEWQKGKLNGIGGKIEEGETPLEAMVREFEEETGYQLKDWREFLLLKGDGFEVHFFSAFAPDHVLYILKGDNEPIEVYGVSMIPLMTMKGCETIPNLRWIIPMGCDKDAVGGTITEHYNC